jgi:serine/threonine-protein kinase
LTRAADLYIADAGNQRIRKIDPSGVITTIAGTGEIGSAGDGRPALSAQFHDPFGVSIGLDGSPWIADDSNGCVRRIDSQGTITTVACG